MTKLGELAQDEASVSPWSLFHAACDQPRIVRLLAVLEAARLARNEVEVEHSTNCNAQGEDDPCSCGVGLLWDAMVECDADPLLATVAPSAPKAEG